MGKKKLKSLIHAQEAAVEPASVDRFLRAYGELTDATADLYRRLERGDPRRQQVHDALNHAQRVAHTALTDAEPDTGPPKKVSVSTSMELVRTPRNVPEVSSPTPPAPVPLLPDESGLIRYSRMRRATRRLPDESTLARYLRDRPLPDESTLARIRRRRRELQLSYR